MPFRGAPVMCSGLFLAACASPPAPPAPSFDDALPTLVAVYLASDFPPDGDVDKPAWEAAPPVVMDRDRHGRPRPELSTRIRALWSSTHLYLAFHCPYRSLTVFDPVSAGDRWELWKRDVVEAFIGTEAGAPRRFKEFEVSPNNGGIDLKCEEGKTEHAWESGWGHATRVNPAAGAWTCEMKIPLAALAAEPPAAGARWRINLYRMEGAAEPRDRLAWSPVGDLSFHTPARFGWLEFRR